LGEGVERFELHDAVVHGHEGRLGLEELHALRRDAFHRIGAGGEPARVRAEAKDVPAHLPDCAGVDQPTEEEIAVPCHPFPEALRIVDATCGIGEFTHG
jgi:hypothetical protein